METAAFCASDVYCQQVLAKHWPNLPIYDDIRTLTGERLQHDGVMPVDLVCGGYPCQPFSVAGKKKGEADSRYL